MGIARLWCRLLTMTIENENEHLATINHGSSDHENARISPLSRLLISCSITTSNQNQVVRLPCSISGAHHCMFLVTTSMFQPLHHPFQLPSNVRSVKIRADIRFWHFHSYVGPPEIWIRRDCCTFTGWAYILHLLQRVLTLPLCLR